MNWQHLLFGGDAVSVTVALLLLAMSVASWVVILWKAWLLRRADSDTRRAMTAFWQAPSLEAALPIVRNLDREALLWPLLESTQRSPEGPLAQVSDPAQTLTRRLRDALHQGVLRLQAGQVILATVGSTAPFVGLLGTVWGIYHALMGITGAGPVGIDKISGPVGEALIMTAAGLAVAIPAVLGYNILGRMVGRIEADLEGFARDLRELILAQG